MGKRIDRIFPDVIVKLLNLNRKPLKEICSVTGFQPQRHSDGKPHRQEGLKFYSFSTLESVDSDISSGANLSSQLCRWLHNTKARNKTKSCVT